MCIRDRLTTDRIDIRALQSHGCYQTIVKTRIIARQQHVVRIDREKKLDLNRAHIERAIEQLDEILPGIDAVIVEDYGKGMLRQQFVDAICERTRKAGKILAVDPNPNNPLVWTRV